MRYTTFVLTSLCWVLGFNANGQSSQEVDAFIEQVRVKTYDCPDSDLIPQLESYLQSETITSVQRAALQVEKTHWLICMGKQEDALAQLDVLLASPELDKTSQPYASAVYQKGFVFDLKEDPQRCEFYRQAEALAENKFDDIYLSAQLGQITVCGSGEEGDDAIKLGRLYALLEQYTSKNDKPAVAHIHNNIGLLYGALGQHVLAAEQYQKSYQMGLGVYKGSNQLATLISVITSQMASGDFAGAKSTINELKRVNLQVNTPLSNVWVHFAESGYYYRTGDFTNLRDSLAKWQVFLAQINSNLYTGLHRWYSAALCLHEQDTACLHTFLEQEEAASAGYKAFVNRNKEYLRLQVEIQLFLGDIAQAEQKFALFADVLVNKSVRQQASGKILGVANLHNQILQLESSLEQAEQQRIWSILSLAAAFIVILVVVLYLLRRKHLARLSADPLTGLYNTRTLINRIKRVAGPNHGLTNALALFDLDNFKEVNSQFGHITGDKALQHVASTLKQVTRDKDILGRLASEQFLVCLTNIEESTATDFFERMRQALEKTILSVETGDKVSLQSSMSIYVSTDAFTDLDEVLNDMQKALNKSGSS